MQPCSVFLAALSLLCAVRASAGGDPLERLARELTKGVQAEAALRVAVLEFPYLAGGPNPGSLIVAERLTTLLAAGRDVEIVERRLIDPILREARLETTGLVDARGASRVGSFLGVDALVLGTLHDVENGLTEVNARLIQSRTGRVLSASTARVEKTWTSAAPAQAAPPFAAPAPARAAGGSRPPVARRIARTPREEETFRLFFLPPPTEGP